MPSLRAVPALLATVLFLVSPRGEAQIEAPRPVEELAPDTPAQRPSRRREPPPPPAPVADEEGT
ncbi:MAG TPA: hypothetical protein VGF41_08415, partial [Myxococcaceae bacterium]